MTRDNRILARQITPDAHLIGKLVRNLDVIVAFQLYEAISHIAAAPNPVVLRAARLGLVIDMIRSGSGEFPKYKDYDELRARRAAELGEEWPSSTALCEAYFGWYYVVRAAMEIHIGRGRVQRNPNVNTFENETYSRLEIDDAIKRCRDELGFWPTQWEYTDWSYLSRQIAWDKNEEIRLPGLPQIRKKCGSFDEAVESLRAQESCPPKSA